MSTETKRKSALVGLFVVVSIVSIAVTAFISQKTTATSFVGAQRGMIHRAYVTYKDSDTITIQPGYGECSLSYWEITNPVDHNMTSLATGEDWHYIYIDDVNSVYPTPTIIDSTTEPVWSDTKLGWYNGYDRCIGVVWSPDSSATILEFVVNPDAKYFFSDSRIYILQNGNPSGSWTTQEATAYMPVNIKSGFFGTVGADWDNFATTQISPSGLGSQIELKEGSYGGYANTMGWLDIPIGHSRDLIWAAGDDDENIYKIYMTGYQIDR